MSITQYLKDHGFNWFEGNIQDCPQQMEDLIQLSANVNDSVMEIGFNAGHSAELLLKNNPRIHLTSFDLGIHNYTFAGKYYIDQLYPGRHTLIIGDSTKTVPNYIQKNPNKMFDLIFIDGGHEYNIASADMKNCQTLANSNTIVVVDDTIFTPGWEHFYNVGPTQTWNENIKNGIVTQIDHRDYCSGRGMSWGKYNLPS